MKEKEKNDTQDEMDDDKMGEKCDSLNRIHTAQQKENDIQDNVAKFDHNYNKTETKSDGIVNEPTIMNSETFDQGEMTVTNSEVKPDSAEDTNLIIGNFVQTDPDNKTECKGDGVGNESIIMNSEIDVKDTPHLDVHYKIDAEGRSDIQDNVKNKSSINENQHTRCIKISKLTNYSESDIYSEMEISDDNSEDYTYEASFVQENSDSDSDNESQEFTIEKTVHGHNVSMKIQREEVKADIPVIDITDEKKKLSVFDKETSYVNKKEEKKKEIPTDVLKKPGEHSDNDMSNKPESEYTDIDRNKMNKSKPLNYNLDEMIMEKSKDPVAKQPDEQNDSDKSEEEISNAGMNDGVTKSASKKIDK